MEKKRSSSVVLLIITACMLLTACNYSVTLAHTEGTTSDLIDQDEKADANVSPSFTIPLKAL